jgi:5-methylcytosine-specific restriction endonuclease McrA
VVDYKKAWVERTRLWAKELFGNHCAECSATGNLEFDHKDPDSKEFNISVGIAKGYSKERLQAELAKCQLLCEACHQLKTTSEREVPHGGGKRGKYNCTCSPCRLKKKEYMREFMQRKRMQP